MSDNKPDHQNRVYKSITEMLSNEDNPTPIVQLNRVVPFKQTKVYAKLEWYNPFGAVKDRIAANLIDDALEKNLLGEVKKIVEPTSGNTGLALTMLSNTLNFNLKAPLSSMIPIEKRTMLKFFGCDVLELDDTLCPAPGAPEGAIAKAIETAERPEYHMLNQYANQANPEAHYKTTGPEVWKQTDQKITHFVAALGTCGTLTGTGTFLKEKNKNIKLIGVHPEEGHDIPGVRSIRQLEQTKLFQPALYDQLVEVSNREAYDMCLRINREESLIAGPSSGLALVGALKIIKDQPDAVVVIMFADNAFKYASSFQTHFPEMFKDIAGSKSNPNNKNKKEELLNNMIELCRNEVNTIELEEAYKTREATAPLYIDVREVDQYDGIHVADAINIPIEDLLTGVNLPEDKDRPIITVCNRGNLSLQGLLILKSHGFSQVKSLNGGTIGWMDKNYPTVKGTYVNKE